MRIKILLLLLSCGLTCLTAQDVSFSQFYANRIYLNPALTGLEDGLSFSGVYRLQWKNIDNGYKTYAASIETKEPYLRSGLGLTLFQDVEGIMELKTTYVGFSYSYTIPMDDNNVHFGLQTRWVQKSVDWSKIIYSDQLDPVYGVVNSTNGQTGQERISFVDFDFGLVWRFQKDLKLGKKKIKNTHNSIGISLHHAPYLFSKSGAVESLQYLDTRVSPRLTIHAGSIIPAFILGGSKKKIKISPNLKYDVQGYELLKPSTSLQVISYGMFMIYEGIYIGATYQNKYPIAGQKQTNALILALGLNIDTGKQNANKYFIGFSYDANTTGVGTRAGGTYELAFRWTMANAPSLFGKDASKRSKRALDCYDFF